MWSPWRKKPIEDDSETEEPDDAIERSTGPSTPEQVPTPTAYSYNVDDAVSAQAASKTSQTSWKEALYRACLKNQCLTRTPRQVLETEHRVQRPRKDQVVVMQQKDDVAAVAQRVVKQLHQESPLQSPIRQVLTGVVSWTVKVYRVIQGESDYEEWMEQHDHVDDSVPLAGWDEPVVCVPLVVECLNRSLPHATNKLALKRHGTSDLTFTAWCTKDTSFKLSSAADLDLMANVFVETGQAVFYQDCIVFGRDLTDTEVQVAVALVQLEEAMATTQSQLEKWSRAADECTRQASEKKKKNDRKAALFELQKRKLLTEKIESARASLLNLETAHTSLETSQMQQLQVLKPLEATASALKAMRQECSVEDVEELQQDLQEEYEESQKFTFASPDIDEEELMKELSLLVIEDKENKEASLMDTTQVSPGSTEKDDAKASTKQAKEDLQEAPATQKTEQRDRPVEAQP